MEAYTKLVIVAVVLGLAIGSEALVMEKRNVDGLCGMSKEGLTACAPSVTAQNPSPPTPECCSALSNADFQCFCVFKSSRLLNLYGIDFNQAMQLPGKCNLPNSSHC